MGAEAEEEGGEAEGGWALLLRRRKTREVLLQWDIRLNDDDKFIPLVKSLL